MDATTKDRVRRKLERRYEELVEEYARVLGSGPSYDHIA